LLYIDETKNKEYKQNYKYQQVKGIQKYPIFKPPAMIVTLLHKHKPWLSLTK